MYSNVGKGITIMYVLLIFVFSYKPAMANQQEKEHDNKVSSLTAQPDQCVALRQGRDCFASVQLQWQAPIKQTVCLFKEGQEKKIKCWEAHDHGNIIIEFESKESMNYQLRTLSNNKVIAQTQIKVSWFHKSSARKRRWRLF